MSPDYAALCHAKISVRSQCLSPCFQENQYHTLSLLTMHLPRFASVHQRCTHGLPSQSQISLSRFPISSFLVLSSMFAITIRFMGTISVILSLTSLTYASRIESSERQVLILLFCIQIFIFASTFAHLVIVALPDAQTAGAVATLLFAMAMIFNG